MQSFQVFIPSDVAADHLSPEQAMSRVGLSHLGRGATTKSCAGPGQQRGRVFAWITPEDATYGYRPDEQTWLPAISHGDLAVERYWVGIPRDRYPTAEELLRPDHRKGSFITLGDGQDWLITRPSDLDRIPTLNPDRTIEWNVDAEFNWLVTHVQKIHDGIVGRQIQDGRLVGGTIVFNDDRDFWFLCRLLEVNYRLTPELCAHMQLFTSQSIRTTIAGLFGLTLQGD